MLDHQQNFFEESGMGVGRVTRCRLLQGLPFPLHSSGSDLGPVTFGQTLAGELQVAGMPGIDLPQGRKGPVDLAPASGEIGISPPAGFDAPTGSERMLRHMLEQHRQRPLIGIADFFELRKPDVLVDPAHDKIEQHGNRQRVGQADQQQATGDRQVLKETRHGDVSGGGDAAAGPPGRGRRGSPTSIARKIGPGSHAASEPARRPASQPFSRARRFPGESPRVAVGVCEGEERAGLPAGPSRPGPTPCRACSFPASPSPPLLDWSPGGGPRCR